jgi:hypothetical protein
VGEQRRNIVEENALLWKIGHVADMVLEIHGVTLPLAERSKLGEAVRTGKARR